MGAWSEGIFENDDAQDWLSDFEDEPAEAVEEALAAVLDMGDDYIEATAAARCLAAAEAVAVAIGAPPDEIDEEILLKLQAAAEEVAEVRKGKARARRAASRILETESELAELWDEDDDAAWRASVDDLIGRLS